MRATILQLGSATLAAVGLVAIALSLLSLSPDLLASEPLTSSGCTVGPDPCDQDEEGGLCQNGTCEAYAIPCAPCCTCLFNSSKDDYFCQYNGEPFCL